MFYELAVSTWGPEEIAAIQRVIASDRFTMGPHVAAFEEAFARLSRQQIRRDGELRLLRQSAVRGCAVLQKGPPAAARRRGDRAGDFLGHDLPSAAAVRTQAQDRRRRARQHQHGHQPARGSDGPSHARDRRRQHPRQSGGTRRDAPVRGRARALFHRGQLRVDGRRTRRPQEPARSGISRLSARSSRITSRPWKAA